MNRKSYLTMTSRALAVLAAFACIAVAVVPGVPPARGAGAVAIAVIVPENSGGVSQAVLTQVGQAVYDGVVATGRYDVRGGGPIHVAIAGTGDALSAALAAGSRAEASQVLLTDVLRVADGKITYRLTTYRIDPVTFGRSQVFQQPFPPSDPHVFSSQFGSDVAALEAPRTNTGTIYSVANGVVADTGAANGFHLGQRFNVVRGGKKVAEAQIDQITDVNATLSILNPTAGYRAQVGDLLISQEPGPAIPVDNAMKSGGGNGALDVIGVLLGAGAVLLAIGHHGSPATVNCPPPTPLGPSCVSPSPTGSGSGSFTVSQTSVAGAQKSPVFTFTFSKPVQNPGALAADITKVSVIDTIPPNPPISTTALTTFAGAVATAVFDGTNTVLTVTVTGQLVSTHAYFINFMSTITAVDSTTLTPASFRYPATGTITSVARQPLPATRTAPGGGNNPSQNAPTWGTPKTPAPHH